MTKAELITQMAQDAGITKVQAEKALKSFTTSVQETLSKGDKVQLIGFGTFSTTERAAREGRNPSTGAAMTIPAKTAVKFKAGQTFVDAVNN